MPVSVPWSISWDSVVSIGGMVGIGAVILEIIRRRVPSVEKVQESAAADRRELWDESAKLRETLEQLTEDYKAENAGLRVEIDRIRKESRTETQELYLKIRDLQKELHETSQTMHAVILAKAELEYRLVDYEHRLIAAGLILPKEPKGST